MATEERDEQSLRDELRIIEQDLADLTKELDELRQEIGDRSDDPGDRVDHTTQITQLEMTEALIAELEARRHELLQRLDQP